MLYYDGEHRLFDFLKPKDGFELKKLVCTTYSLSLSKAFSLAVAITQPVEDNLNLKDVALLKKDELFNNANDKLKIYYQNFL